MKFKPNEVIGLCFSLLGIMVFAEGIDTSFTLWHLLAVGFCGLMMNVFYSWWGLTSFNKLVGRLTPHKDTV